MIEATRTGESLPGRHLETAPTYALLYTSQPTPLLRCAGGRLEPLDLSPTQLEAWQELASGGAQTALPTRVHTPLGGGWMLLRFGRDLSERVLVCAVDGETAAPVPSEALAGHLELVAALVLARHELHGVTTQLHASAEELGFCHWLEAQLRRGVPRDEWVAEVPRRLREAVAADMVWLWSDTDLRRRPGLEHGATPPDRGHQAAARRAAETVMAGATAATARPAGGYLAAPLTTGSLTWGAIVCRLELGHPGDEADRLGLWRALADHLSLALSQPLGDAPAANTAAAGPDDSRVLLNHDLNNLLATVALEAEVGAADSPDPATATHFEAIHTHALAAARVLRRVLVGETEAEASAEGDLLDLGELTRDLLARQWPAWRENAALTGVTYELATEFAEDVHVRVDRAAMEDVIMRLLANALEAMPRGGDLEVRVSRAGEQALLQVRDTGLGMSPEVLNRACDPFYSTKRGDHVGLGLTVVQSLCQASQGRFLLLSSAGSGTTAEAYLPLAVPLVRRRPAARARAVKAPLPPALNILLADEERVYREALVSLLQRLGHRITVAADGREALTLLRQRGPYDVLLADLTMPEMSGWELAGLSRRLQPETKIIMVTGWGEGAATINDGRLDGVLPKPFAFASLVKLLEAIEPRTAAVPPGGARVLAAGTV